MEAAEVWPPLLLPPQPPLLLVVAVLLLLLLMVLLLMVLLLLLPAMATKVMQMAAGRPTVQHPWTRETTNKMLDGQKTIL